MRVKQEVFMPLIHRPGEAQVDFGYAQAKIFGVLRKAGFFVMVLPYSDVFFVMAFERECTESYWKAHTQAFESFGVVPTRISYDNSTVLLSKILGPRDRKLTDGFLQLQSHYLFREHFCRVRRANEKGLVEGVVKFTRLNFFVPVPQVRDLDELNGKLAEMCQKDLQRRLRGKTGTKAERLKEDEASFLPLPPVPFDAYRKQPTRANSLSLVRFDDDDYSVPVSYAHHEILIKGYVDRVVLCNKDRVVAEHRRSWGKEGIFFDYRHYLPLLERKPGSMDYARPPGGSENVCFYTATNLVAQLVECREEKRLQRLHKQLQKLHLLVIDELGYVPFSKAGAELLFEVISRAYEHHSLMVTTNLAFEEWAEIFGSERLTGALLDRLTHRCHILEANGESYRLQQARKRSNSKPSTRQDSKQE
jgi:hypothetical protein